MKTQSVSVKTSLPQMEPRLFPLIAPQFAQETTLKRLSKVNGVRIGRGLPPKGGFGLRRDCPGVRELRYAKQKLPSAPGNMVLACTTASILSGP